MIRYLQSKSFKMALSATISVLISNHLGLKFGVTSGIIAILSIQDTKKDSVVVSIKRIAAAIIGILLSYMLYIIQMNILEGMVPASVLSTHLLTSSNIDKTWIINEILLTIVGVGVAMMFNLYTISLEEDFENNKAKIEDYYRTILSDLAVSLVTQKLPADEKEVFDYVENLIDETKIMAQKIYKNYFLKSNEIYISYVDMRSAQFESLKRMKRHFSRFYMTYDQTKLLSEFTQDVAVNIYADNDCRQLIEKLNVLREEYKAMELPQNREEFENRALLLQFLNDLEDFLMIKREFKKKF